LCVKFHKVVNVVAVKTPHKPAACTSSASISAPRLEADAVANDRL
jgi:hypothetical protein